MSPLVKICGLTDPAAVLAAAEGADLGGFVFFEQSPRHLSYDAAKSLSAHVPPRLKKVALTVDANDAHLEAIMGAIAPDYIQFHGSEPLARLEAVKARWGVQTIKAMPVETAADLEAARVYDGHVELLLFDAKPLKATRPGGWGSTFDWSLMAGTAWASPWLLAGGLTPENVAAALQVTGAPGVDVSSGVEVDLGRKSPKLIKAFVQAAKGSG